MYRLTSCRDRVSFIAMMVLALGCANGCSPAGGSGGTAPATTDATGTDGADGADGTATGTGMTGTTTTGTDSTGGPEVAQCVPKSPSVDATCDAIDDDCDGATDEDFIGADTDCGVGACVAHGRMACQDGVPKDTCTPPIGAANDATCDGVDDDCDGKTDEEFLGICTACSMSVPAIIGSLVAGEAVVPFDRVAPELVHKFDVDPIEHGCLSSIDLAFDHQTGCRFHVVAGGARRWNGGLRVTAIDLEADSYCLGFSDAKEGHYVGGAGLTVAEIVPSAWNVSGAGAGESCVTMQLTLKLEGYLERESDGAHLEVSGTQIMVAGNLRSTGNAAAKCPCSGECAGASCGEDGCGFDCGTCPASAAGKTWSCDGSRQCAWDCEGGYHACGDSCGFDGDSATCGNRCDPCPAPSAHGSARCDFGTCAVACEVGYHACGTTCYANTDVAHCMCSGCGAAPAHGSFACQGGATCAIKCDTGYHPCGDACVNDLDPQTCGTSCEPCPTFQGADATCTPEGCGFVCASGYHRCDDICRGDDDARACGESCEFCDLDVGPHAVAACVTGECGKVCDAGYVPQGCGPGCYLPWDTTCKGWTACASHDACIGDTMCGAVFDAGGVSRAVCAPVCITNSACSVGSACVRVPGSMQLGTCRPGPLCVSGTCAPQPCASGACDYVECHLDKECDVGTKCYPYWPWPAAPDVDPGALPVEGFTGPYFVGTGLCAEFDEGWLELGDACVESADCASGGCAASGQRTYCSQPCVVQSDCSNGTKCVTALSWYDGEGMIGRLCAPSDLEPGEGQQVIINEIDFNQVGEDTREFVELYNPHGIPQDLSGLSLEYVHPGATIEVVRQDLNGTIPAKGYVVVGLAAVVVQNGARLITMTSSLENGPNDGVRLVRRSPFEVLDAFVYDVSVPMSPAVAAYVEGAPFTRGESTNGSLARCPNGADQDNNASDFADAPTPTPGATNSCP